MTAATATIADQAISETVERTLARYPRHEARIRRAARLLEIDAVTPLGGDRYSVRSQANASESYLVTLPESKYPTCGCKDFERQGKGCKHQWAAHMHRVAAERYAALAQREAPASPRENLTADEIRALTLWKWSYSLETTGFDRETARRLLFAKWLAARKILSEE